MDGQEAIVIASAARTPVGSFSGVLSTVPAHDLGKVVITEALARAHVDGSEVSEVILGQILAAGQGQNPARQAAINASLPVETTAMGINFLCGSGLRSVAMAAQGIRLGDSDIVVAGGQENMSLAPHCQYLRQGVRMGHFEMLDTMIRDGLTDVFNGYHMGVTAENVARQFQITRAQQDELALGSQNKASAARREGRFKDEIAPVTIKGRKGDTIVSQDEFIRDNVVLDDLAKLRPAFDKAGTVTAGNASGINDGAAAVVVMKRSAAEKRGIEPLARIVSWATSGVDPSIMGTGPIRPRSMRWKRRAGRRMTSTSSRPTRHLPRKPAPSTRPLAGTRRK